MEVWPCSREIVYLRIFPRHKFYLSRLKHSPAPVMSTTGTNRHDRGGRTTEDMHVRRLTVIVPAYNEARSLPSLVSELDRMASRLLPEASLRYGYEVDYLVVDDGSSDNTSEVLRGLRDSYPELHYLTLTRNFGKENALMAGFDYAGGDCVLMMDADGQHPVEAVPQMLRQWEDGYDDVYGRRLSRSKESFLRRRFTMAYYRLLQKSTRIDMLPNVGDFRLLDRRCVDAMRDLRETQRNTKGLLCWIGYRKTGVDFTPLQRGYGSSRFTMRRLFSLALEGITGFTTAPLKFATIMGMVVSLIAFIYILFILCKTLIWGEPVQGYPTLMCVILFLGGCQLLAIGIIGEYIGRIFSESKRRPVYIADSLDGRKI